MCLLTASYYWSRRFSRDPHVLGRKFRSGKDVYQVVGVAPQGFTGTETGALTDVFVPTMMNTQSIEAQNWHWLRIWVRMKPDIEPEPTRQKLRGALLAYRQEQVKSVPRGTPQREIRYWVSAPLFLEPRLVWANGHSPEGDSSLPWFLAISPGWFGSMKIALLDGRDFRPDDSLPRVAAVNQAFARHYFDGRNPVGSTLQTIADDKSRVTLQIVGGYRLVDDRFTRGHDPRRRPSCRLPGGGISRTPKIGMIA